ncbi:hypothetical protein P4T31_12610 [Bacillus paramycoides]|nr:hypothetical protein [Bacillus paramycoides]
MDFYLGETRKYKATERFLRKLCGLFIF